MRYPDHQHNLEFLYKAYGLLIPKKIFGIRSLYQKIIDKKFDLYKAIKEDKTHKDLEVLKEIAGSCFSEQRIKKNFRKH
ncbi:hypothetical protein Ob7_06653 [Thermosipho africanus Ob7]|uniref:hypothetical protein n=1 Tax=Thermosipho africanus TaxID=2421 RepID=UPI000E2D0134|nr:hypothetical protein [Thermosipho africanus]RDI91120.1 hypothetical protein Ob7_06653 [Thermosipho africanus Ob7]